MTAAEAAVRLALKLGVTLSAEGDRIRWRARGELPPVVAHALREHRPAVLRLLADAGRMQRLTEALAGTADVCTLRPSRRSIEPASHEERALLAASDRREAWAREAAQTRVACGTGLRAGDPFAELRDRYLVAGKSIAEATRLARAEYDGGAERGGP
jgi:hypothetical protein